MAAMCFNVEVVTLRKTLAAVFIDKEDFRLTFQDDHPFMLVLIVKDARLTSGTDPLDADAVGNKQVFRPLPLGVKAQIVKKLGRIHLLVNIAGRSGCGEKKPEAAGEKRCGMQETAIDYREILYGSEDYRQTLSLRDRVLRQPWGHSIEEDDLTDEKQSLVFGAFEGARLVGVAVLLDDGTAHNRLRYMAVDPAYQGRGIGAAIVREFERRSAGAGKEGIRLMARLHVRGFYEKLGYRAEGEPFEPDHIAIPHIMMSRPLE